MTYLNEDILVQQTTADYLRDKLGWDSVYAHKGVPDEFPSFRQLENVFVSSFRK